jgi:Na+/proline symporter
MPDSRATIHAVLVLVYLLALLGVGVRKARRVRTQVDFSLAGRQLSTFVLFGTLLATWIGTGSIFGNSEKTVEVGIAAWFLPLGGVLGILVLAPLAPRVRRFEGSSPTSTALVAPCFTRSRRSSIRRSPFSWPPPSSSPTPPWPG